MKKKYNIIALFALLLSVNFMFSCSENNPDEEEYQDWQNKNELFFKDIYNKAKQQIAAGNKEWKVIPTYTMIEAKAEKPENNIVVKVINNGNGTESPLASDTVAIHYQGKLIPSKSYSKGFMFDSTWKGIYDLETMMPYMKLSADQYIEGFATALLHMKKGDRWEIYIPQQLGYGKSTSNAAIPAYSTLIFDVTLVDFYKKGTVVPKWKIKQNNTL